MRPVTLMSPNRDVRVTRTALVDELPGTIRSAPMGYRIVVLRRTALVTLLTGALLLAACGDDGESDAGAQPAGSTSGDDLASSVEDVRLHPLQDDADMAELVGSPPPEVLGDLLGDRPIVLNFFASWCAPCIAEMPTLESVHQDLDDDVLFVGMAFQDGDDRARDIIETTGVTYPTFSDPDGNGLLFFESVAMPTTAFIAPDGEVLHVESGELDEGKLRDLIDEHFRVT